MNDKKVVEIPLELAEHIQEYLLLLRQVVYAPPEVRNKAIEKLDGYGTPVVAFDTIVDKCKSSS